MLSRFFDIQLKTKRYNAVWNEFLRYQQNQQKVPGEIKFEFLNSLTCCKKNEPIIFKI